MPKLAGDDMDRPTGERAWSGEDEPDPYTDFLRVRARQFLSDAEFVRWESRYEKPHQVLQALRLRFLLTQERVAAHTGLSTTAISRWESGKRTPHDKWELEELLSVPQYGLTAFQKSVVFMHFEWAPLFWRRWTPDWIARRIDALRAEPDDDPCRADDTFDADDADVDAAPTTRARQARAARRNDAHDRGSDGDSSERFEPLDPDDLLTGDDDEAWR